MGRRGVSFFRAFLMPHVDGSNLSLPRAPLTFVFGLPNVGKESFQFTWFHSDAHLFDFGHA
jgi:hypothetical protein